MNIIILCDYAYVEGGATKVAIDSALLLANAGHKVTYFTGARTIDPRLKNAGIRVETLGQEDLKNDKHRIAAFFRGLWNLKASRMLGKLLSEFPEDETIVHVHYWAKILSPSIFHVLRRHDFKVFETCHEYYLSCGNGAFFNYRANKVCCCAGVGLKCLFTNCDRKSYLIKIWRFVRQLIVRYQLLRFPKLHLITISDLNEYLVRRAWGGRFVYSRLNNPIPFASGATMESNKKDVFYFVGRVCQEKATLLFAQAVSNAGAKGVVIGDGPDLKLVKQRYPQIECTGWLGPTEIYQRVNKDACSLVFTSAWFEAEPLTPLEMMSVGVPCIISDVTAAKEYIKDGITGLLYKSGDVDDLVRKIKFMLHPENREMIARAMEKEFDHEAWSMKSHLDGLLSLYRR